MNTKIIMLSSAVVMAAAGLALEFAPHEILNRFGADSTGVFPLFLQLIGALYLGFAMINYMARGAVIGGIYSRPLAMGNFLHFVVGALALVKYAFSAQTPPPVWLTASVYTVFAVSFGFILFTHPLKEKPLIEK